MLLTILTACSNRKRARVGEATTAHTLAAGDIESVAIRWAEQLKGAASVVPADQLYCGRGFQEARAVAKDDGARLLIVSAGLGLLTADQRIPAYSLTVSSGWPDSILPKLPKGSTAADWWTAMSQHSAFHTPLRDHITTGPTIIALPGEYLAMVAPDLLALGLPELEGVRIISRAAAETVHPRLRPLLIPYDERLEDARSPWRGTRADFASRAARHFAETVLAANPDGDAEAHRQAVERELAVWAQPTSQKRERKTDEEILALLRNHWDSVGGSGSRLLRLFRDDLMIACEQGRMAGLVGQVRKERTS